MIKVIAAIDNTAVARPVIAAAQAVAHVLGATVEALHIREDGEMTLRGEADAAGIPLRVIEGPTDPAEEITKATAATDVAALVLGARGTPGGKRPAGHLVLDVITAIRKPVVVVPPESPIKDKLHSVLVPMMGHPTRAASVRSTIELVNASHIEVIVLHVYDEATIPSFSDQSQYETEEWAQEFLARYVPIPPEAVRLELRVGVPVQQIIQVCGDTHADMIAMGWTQSLEPGRGELVRAVLERAAVPVILLPVLAEPGKVERDKNSTWRRTGASA